MRQLLFWSFLAAAPLLPPAAPTITEPAVDGQILNPADVHMEAGGYSDPEGDVHGTSDWEIWKVSASERIWSAAAVIGLLKVHVHLADGSFENSYAGRTELEFGTDYLLRVRFTDSTGESSAFSERPFQTSLPGPPPLPVSQPWRVLQLGYRIETVASGFQMPVNIAFVPAPGPNPTDPVFYVTELYGKVRVVQRNGTIGDYATGLLNYTPNGAFPGAGEQGVAGLLVEPSTGDVLVGLLVMDLASPLTPKPVYPRVIRLHSLDGGRTAATQTTLLDMPGEAQGQSHQISNLSWGPDGRLYVHNGDGFDASTAQNLNSFRGKILRLNPDGTPPSDNPFYDAGDGISSRDYVYAYGFRNPFGGDWRLSDGFHYEVENGPSHDRFAKVVPGRNYLWNGTDASMHNFALYNWVPAHGPVNLVFIQAQTMAGSGFPPAKMDHAFVAESGPTYAPGAQANGKRISEFVLTPQGALAQGPVSFLEYNGSGRASVVGLAAGPDGLYFTDLYRDQGGSATSPGANVHRVRYIGAPANGNGTGLQGYYYDNKDLTNPRLARLDAGLGFDWGSGSPDPKIAPDTFSVRWTGQVQARYSDSYTFLVNSDDGVRLRVNGQLLIDDWTDHGPATLAGTTTLVAGQKYDLVLEYYNNQPGAVARLLWTGPSQPTEQIPAGQLYPLDLRDNDGDGIPNARDPDNDNDGIPDTTDPDIDGDGVSNTDELSAGTDSIDKAWFPTPAVPASSGGRCGATGLVELAAVLLLRLLRRSPRRTSASTS